MRTSDKAFLFVTTAVSGLCFGVATYATWQHDVGQMQTWIVFGVIAVGLTIAVLRAIEERADRKADEQDRQDRQVAVWQPVSTPRTFAEHDQWLGIHYRERSVRRLMEEGREGEEGRK